MIIGFLLLYVLLLLNSYKKDKNNFRPFTVLAYTVLVFILAIYLFNEIFSLGNLISSCSILTFWIVFDASLFIILYQSEKDKKNLKNLFSLLKKDFNNNKLYYLIFLILSFILVAVAVCIVPFNYDSHTYHLTRIAVWFKNGSIAHFATADTRMLGTPPLKEFVDLHIYGLLGRFCDNLLNLTQTFSFIINSLLILEIADRIGCKKKGKIAAVAIFASTATVLAEAFSTQTDEFAALFVLIFIVLVLDIVKNQKFIKIDKKSFMNMLFLGMSIAFSYLAKPSCVFAIMVFTIYLMIVAIKKKAKFSVFVSWLSITAMFTVVFASFELLRNIYTYGSIFDPWQGPGQLVQTLDIRYLFVNMLKNIGTNIRHTSLTYIVRGYDNFVYFVAKILHVDVGNALISEVPGDIYNLTIPENNYIYSHDTAVNFLFFILFFVSILIGIVNLIKTKKFKFDYRLVSFVSFFIALCFIKWEPFMARYLVTYFGVVAPAMALLFEEYSLNGKNRYLDVIVIIFCIMMFGSVLDYHYACMYNPTRYDERDQAYYVHSYDDYVYTYLELKDALKDVHVDNIGFDFRHNGQYSYPTFRLLEKHSDNVEMINVANKTSKYEDKNFIPDLVVISCRDCPKKIKSYKYNGIEYTSIERVSKDLILVKP